MAGSAQTLLLSAVNSGLNGNVQILVVAGGGYGGSAGGSPYASQSGGGGGAGGGVITGNIAYVAGNYTVTVGGGSSNSAFSSYTAIAGGPGFYSNYPSSFYPCFSGTSGDGGSGGGGGAYNDANCKTYGNGIAGQGYNGGGPSYGDPSGGGGGGAGGPGQAGGSYPGRSNDAGDGGYAMSSDISGTLTYYAGGGGGGKGYVPGSGGSPGYGGGIRYYNPPLKGGAGDGATNCYQGYPGDVNTGGGGGGAGGGFGSSCGGKSGGLGGSGIVIIKYPDSIPAAVTTGSPTITVSGGYRIYKFTGSGTIQLV